MRTIASASVLLLGLLAAGCNGELVSGGGAPAKMLVVSGDLQSAPVGTELPQPLVVRVVDESNQPVQNQLVNFVVTAGGGSVFAGAAITNAQGEARERWTLGTVAGDTQRVEARAVDPQTGAKLVFATFRAVASAAAPSTIVPLAAQVTGLAGLPLADSAAVVVRDPYGNPVPGAQVAWSVTGGGGSVSPASSLTNAQGVARTQWTLGGSIVASQTLQAAAGVSLTATITANAGVGAAAVLTRVSGDRQAGPVSAELAQPLVVELRQNGQPVAGAQVVWAPAPGMGTVTPATSITDAQGRASTRWTLGTGVGTQTVAAQAQGGSAVVYFSAQGTPGAPATLERVAPPADANPRYGGLDSLYVRVRDVQGNLVPGATVRWTVVNGGGTVTAQSTTDPGGVAMAIWQLDAHVTDQAVSASIAGLNPVLYRWDLVNSLPAATFARAAGDGQTATLGTSTDRRLQVRLTDAQGNGIYYAPVQWVGPGGTVVRVDTTTQEGYSHFWPTVGTSAGPQTFTARTAGMPDVTFTVTAVAGPANGLRMGRDTLLHMDMPRATYAIAPVHYDASGQPMTLTTSDAYNGITVRLLDNTGTVQLFTSGVNIRGHAFRILGPGTDRIEVTRTATGAADTVTVHARERVIHPGMWIDMKAAMPREMGVGETLRAMSIIEGSPYDTNAARQVTWSSSNPAVATIDASGYITAVGPGIAVITVQGMWGGTGYGYVLVRRP